MRLAFITGHVVSNGGFYASMLLVVEDISHSPVMMCHRTNSLSKYPSDFHPSPYRCDI